MESHAVNLEELEQAAGGKPGLFDGILMLGAWIACGLQVHRQDKDRY